MFVRVFIHAHVRRVPSPWRAFTRVCATCVPPAYPPPPPPPPCTRRRAGEDIPEEELAEMIAEADRDGDGQVTLDDFVRVMRRKGDPFASSDDEDEEGGARGGRG